LRESRAVFGWHQRADIRGWTANNAERFARDRSVLRTSCPSAIVAAFGLSARNFEPLTPPDPLDPLGIDQPARVTQQRCNLAIAIASVLASQCDDVGGQPLFVVPPRGGLRCVERCWPSTAQARRSETDSSRRTCSMQARRRAGLSSFPGPPPSGSAYPASDWPTQDGRHTFTRC
jgi:hypothetical protein